MRIEPFVNDPENNMSPDTKQVAEHDMKVYCTENMISISQDCVKISEFMSNFVRWRKITR